jgi:hypothetical protein
MTSTPEGNPSRPEPDPVGSDGRRNRLARQLPIEAACALCGERNLQVLRKAKVRRSLLEGHHVAGQANDKVLAAILCLNCHAKATVLQLEVGAIPPGQRNSCLEAMELAMRSVGTFFDQLAEACYRWAAQLGQVIVVLDRVLPGWRTLPGMP